MIVTYSKDCLPEVGDVLENGWVATSNVDIDGRQWRSPSSRGTVTYQYNDFLYGLTATRPAKKVTGELVGVLPERTAEIYIRKVNLELSLGTCESMGVDFTKRVALVILEDTND